MAHPPTFFEWFGYLGTCVLPAEVLDDTLLTDPETGLTQPSLRQCCSRYSRLCYAHVLCVFAEGLYWANVAATPDLADAERVVLTETHLRFALAWDERLRWRTPTQIRRLMQAHVRDLDPLGLHAESEPADTLLPASVVPLTIVETNIEVTANDLRTALTPEAAPRPQDQDTSRRTDKRLQSAFALQQGFLQALLHALQQYAASALDAVTAQTLQTRCALVVRVRDFQRQTRQRVVNAVAGWSVARQCLVWHLTLGVPEALLAESAVQLEA